ncbi:Uncharacterised protein [Serratia fonticola]|uniref:Uncharacterized protein n=1 Tax=Serratia fonticola TaxID=47917 RepID=A0A4V6KSK3_SERFO|nr:Uncharacterised protein [Serratia fonticola]
MGAKRVMRSPSAVSRNLVKFHLIRWLPNRPGARRFNSLKQGMRLRAVDVDLAEQRKADAIIEGAEVGNLQRVARLLPAKLIAGEAQHHQPA